MLHHFYFTSFDSMYTITEEQKVNLREAYDKAVDVASTANSSRLFMNGDGVIYSGNTIVGSHVALRQLEQLRKALNDIIYVVMRTQDSMKELKDNG